ncbi:HAD-like protein [Clathrospora elynae]|uniref:HAD-like protein n=1 Tax=Clathrospora elynae TaxID=706981 RepID=A0A6A5SEY3_9PLEO|nr:HAD-like protein [Clathrospora elynae]
MTAGQTLPYSSSTATNQEDRFSIKWPLPYTSLILDLGDVLAHYSPEGLDLPTSAFQLKYILSSSDWFDHECRRLSRDECFERVKQTFKVEPEDLRETLRLLASSMTYDNGLIDLVRYLKKESNEELKVYLASNISEDDWQTLKPAVESWAIFDGIFTSFKLGTRKPDQDFYLRILEATGTDPEKALFVDDKPENLVTAQMLGYRGVQGGPGRNVSEQLRNAFGDPAARGQAWIQANAKHMWSLTNTGVILEDQFAQLMILHITRDFNLITVKEKRSERWNTFMYKPVLTTQTYPDDLDTTTLAFLAPELEIATDFKKSIMDEMLEYQNRDGLFYTYFDKTRPRVDILISANILRLFYAYGRGHEVRRTVDQIIGITRTRAYEFGMRYYYHPDWFFYYLSDLCAQHHHHPDSTPTHEGNHISGGTASSSTFDSNDDHVRNPELKPLRDLLVRRLEERMGGCAGEFTDPWSAALRLSAAHALGLRNERDAKILRRTQQNDGSWGKEPWIYRYGNGILIGNTGLVTALAVKGLRQAADLTA